MQDLQMDNLAVLLVKHRLRYRSIVAFRPTGWTFSSKNPRKMSTCCSNPTGKIHVYGLPYSEHSSFSELCDFVKVVNPRAIIPTVGCSLFVIATTFVDVCLDCCCVIGELQQQAKCDQAGQCIATGRFPQYFSAFQAAAPADQATTEKKLKKQG